MVLYKTHQLLLCALAFEAASPAVAVDFRFLCVFHCLHIHDRCFGSPL